MSMYVSSIDLYEDLRGVLGDAKAKTLVNSIDQKVNEALEAKKDILATKKDIYELTDKLSEKMSSHFKWIIGLFIGQMAFVLGLVYFVLNFHK